MSASVVDRICAIFSTGEKPRKRKFPNEGETFSVEGERGFFTVRNGKIGRAPRAYPMIGMRRYPASILAGK